MTSYADKKVLKQISKCIAIQCNQIIYHKSLRNVSVNKEKLEEIAFDIEIEKEFTEYDDWKRLEKWQIGRARFP